MNLSTDDPQLTAYALGELDDAERAAIEAALKDSPECRAAVEEIRATAGLLTSELAAEPCPELTPAQRAALTSPATATVVPFPWWRVWRTAGIAAAAASVVGFVGWAVFEPGITSKRVVKRGESKGQAPTPVYGVDPRQPAPRSSSDQSGGGPALAGTGFTATLWSGQPADGENVHKQTVTAGASERLPSSVVMDGKLAYVEQNAEHFFLNPIPIPANDPMSQGALLRQLDSGGTVVRLNGGSVTYAAQANSSALAGQNGFISQEQVIPKRGANGASGLSGSAGFRFNGEGRSSFANPLQQRVWRESESKADGYYVVTGPSERSGEPGQPGYNPATPLTAYAPFIENAFVPVLQEPLSTFSIDVDTASYANVRRFLNSGKLPPRAAVRIEELINYFTYAYPPPRGDDPFSASIETAGCPWAPGHRLVRVALRGRELPRDKRPPSNFVFLIDVSGSMQPAERLPLLKQALRALVKKMTDNDRVAIVVYASEAGIKLESTSCADKEKILAVIDALEAGGSTNGGEGIQQAYAMARRNFIEGGVNRVILCTDGDFNVGLTDQNALVALVKEHAKGGVFLTTLGVGTDNYKDALMQRLADRANGNYHYLDTLEEAQKVLVEQMNATLVTIAKDVKIQVEFNPAQVSAYRLIGYEKWMLRTQDFNNDKKDAGEIGAGHTVTAFYEIVPAGAAAVRPVVDKLKYQSAVAPASYSEKGEHSKELLTLKLRYKQPDGDTSKLLEFPHSDNGGSYGKASGDFKFASAVAGFGMILRDSEHKGSATFDSVLELAGEGKGADDGGWRAEFINLVKKAKALGSRAAPLRP